MCGTIASPSFTNASNCGFEKNVTIPAAPLSVEAVANLGNSSVATGRAGD
jgi:hypothetical protein